MTNRNSRIAVIDYGLSNLTCVCAAVNRLGHEVEVVSKSENLKKFSHIILPGVGAFGDAMKNLRHSGMDRALEDCVIKNGVPFLGICLGAQLVCAASEEFGDHKGLGWFDCRVRKIPSSDKGFRVPHTGWDELRHVTGTPLTNNIGQEDLFYFTHSYGIQSDDDKDVSAYCDYTVPLVAILARDNIYATQFHPEKSQQKGLVLLGNFLSMIDHAA